MYKKIDQNHEKYMRRAMNLALKARGKTSPNPMVGAVFVKNNKVIAEGYHHRAGQAHAEVEALKNLSKKQINGGTLYVTLEPCAHFGRTPPCTNFLIKKGVKHLVIAMKDPNPFVAGKGIRQLKKAGVKIEIGVLQKEAEEMNEIYIYAMKHQLPFVILKMASTIDGKIATKKGDSKWISNEKSRTKVHHLRNEVDAILTSAKTVLADNPHLGVHMIKGRDPRRIILDPQLQTSPLNQVYRDKNVLIATNTSSPLKRRNEFLEAKIELLLYPGNKIPLKALLKDLFKKGLHSIMIEAGGGIATSFIKAKLVQKAYFFIAPKIIGDGKNMVQDLNIKKMSNAFQLEKVHFEKFAEDILISGYF